MTSFFTFLLCACITMRYQVQMKLKRLKDAYSKSTCCFAQRYKELSRWLLEIAICSFHIPPMVECVIL